jgi:branched-subunit amino acid transport protein
VNPSAQALVQADPWTLLTVALLAVVTVVARCFFFLSSRPWTLPTWAQRSLRYAPLAALSAVVIPEVVMSQGQLIQTWQDARLFAVAAGVAFFFWRHGQGQAILGTIIVGMAVYVPLHVGLGW